MNVNEEWKMKPPDDGPQPSIIKAYNSATGGIDSYDQWLSYLRPAVKTRRYLMYTLLKLKCGRCICHTQTTSQYKQNISNTTFYREACISHCSQVELCSAGYCPDIKAPTSSMRARSHWIKYKKDSRSIHRRTSWWHNNQQNRVCIM